MAAAPSPWGSNAWGEQFWEDNGLVINYGAWGSLVEGFGDGTWGLGSQLSTLSTSAGTAIAAIDITVAVTGQALTTSIGTETVSADANVPAYRAIALTGSLGTETAVPGVEVAVTGQALTGSIGTETVSADANVTPTGSSATMSMGTADAGGNAVAELTGIALTTSIGAEAVEANAECTSYWNSFNKFYRNC